MRTKIGLLALGSLVATSVALAHLQLPDDVNHDARADIFFAGGTALAYWTLAGSAAQPVITSTYAGDAGPGYTVIAVDDYDGDTDGCLDACCGCWDYDRIQDAAADVPSATAASKGSADVLWADGSGLKMWLNNGAGNYQPVLVGSYGGGWQPFATGDINKDGKSDIFFRGGTSLGYWLMDGAKVIASNYAGDGGTGFRVVAINDFDGDSSADVLWTNGSQLKLWFNDGAGSYRPVVVASYGGGWQPFAAGDINRDGYADVLFRGGSAVAYWLMAGTTVIDSRYAGDGGAGFRAIAVSDYDGDQFADILWTNGSQIKLWRQGTSPTGYVPSILGSYGNGWQPLDLLISN